MKFQVGDLVFLRRYPVMVGTIEEVDLVTDGRVVSVKWEKLSPIFCYTTNELVLAVKDNEINRKLYPNRIEHIGYLVKKSEL